MFLTYGNPESSSGPMNFWQAVPGQLPEPALLTTLASLPGYVSALNSRAFQTLQATVVPVNAWVTVGELLVRCAQYR
jgi:hypothetical protein